MASFTKKVLGLAGVASVFAGMAFGQGICAAPTLVTGLGLLRAEGTTEQVASTQFVCTNAAGSGAVGIAVSVFSSLPVTSKVVVNTGSKTEATLTLTASAGGGAVVVLLGTVSGSTISFSGTAPLVAVGGTLTAVLTNVRVNANSQALGTGAPPPVTEAFFVAGPAVVPASLAAATVGYVTTGLAPLKLYKNLTNGAGPVDSATGFPRGVTGSTAGFNTFVVCNNYSVKRDTDATTAGGLGQSTATAATYAGGGGRSLATVIEVGEASTSAFHSVFTAANGGEGAQTLYTAGAAVGGFTLDNGNAAISTRIRLSFSNVPAGVTLLLPIGTVLSQGSTMAIQQITSETGTTASATDGLAGESGTTQLRAVTLTAGAGSVVFQVTQTAGTTDDTTTLDKFHIPVFIIAAANATTASSTAFSVSASFGPIASTSFPSFVIGASTAAVTASTFSSCTTSLLFPFVTNQQGFDTGLAISNTSTDPFGTSGATAQAGTCSLNFYGTGAPTPASITTANVVSGTVLPLVVSGVAAGFQGYVIAQCNFQYAHGFAFITSFPNANAVAQGYLAGVIPDVNQSPRSANPSAIAAAGSGETLGN